MMWSLIRSFSSSVRKRSSSEGKILDVAAVPVAVRVALLGQ